MAPRNDDPFDQEAARREWAREVRRVDRDVDAAYQQGLEDAATTSPPSSSSSPAPAARRASSSSSSLSVAAEPAAHVSTLILTAIGWALALAFLREGPAGPKRWILAKFANRTT
jgi:hypothetical protein